MGDLIPFPGSDDAPDIDDSMEANPEPAHVDLGYDVTTEPRRKRRADRLGQWVVQFREGGEMDPGVAPIEERRCRICNERSSVFVSHGADIRRNVCPKCQGEENGKLYPPATRRGE